MPERTIFRPTAVEAYRRGTEKDVIPRMVSRPVTVCRWLLLALLVATAALAWWVTVPAYVDASGVIVGPGDAPPLGAQTAAVLLLPPDGAAQVRVGRPVHLETGSSGTDAQGVVAAVERGVLTPEEARQRYPALGPDPVPESSVVVVVRLADPHLSGSGAGTRVTAQVQAGTQRLIALLPGLPSGSAG